MRGPWYIGLLCAALFAVLGPWTTAQAQMFCTAEREEIERLTASHGEVYLFGGISKRGVPYMFYVGEASWSIFVVDPANGYCTMPELIGEVFDRNSQFVLPKERRSL